MAKQPKIPVKFYLDEIEQKQKLETIAKENYLNVSQYMRIIVLYILSGKINKNIIRK